MELEDCAATVSQNNWKSPTLTLNVSRAGAHVVRVLNEPLGTREVFLLEKICLA